MSSYIKKVEELTDDQITAIECVGFGNLLHVPLHTLRKNLLVEWMDRWDSARRAFQLLDQELTIKPTDAALILGLRATGKPVVLAEEPFSVLEEEYGATANTRKISVLALERRLESLGNSASEDFVRTFILFTFGTLLFYNSGKIDSRFLFLLQDLSKVSEYAWGVAVIEDLFNWLTRWKDEQLNSIEGCLILLQIWSYEHIDIGRPNLLTESSSFPRACRWESSRSNSPRHWFTSKFNEVEENQVVWKLQPTPAESKIDIINELLGIEEANEGQLLKTTKGITTKPSIQYVGLPPKSSSQSIAKPAMDEQREKGIHVGKHDAGKNGGQGRGKHEVQADSPEKSTISTDVSAVTVDFPECSSSYGTVEVQNDQLSEIPRIFNSKEEYWILKTENSKMNKDIGELERENNILRNKLSLNLKSEEIIAKLRKEVADLTKEIQSLRPPCDAVDEIEELMDEYFDGMHHALHH